MLEVHERMILGSGLCGDLPKRHFKTHESTGRLQRVKPMQDVNGLGGGLTP